MRKMHAQTGRVNLHVSDEPKSIISPSQSQSNNAQGLELLKQRKLNWNSEKK